MRVEQAHEHRITQEPQRMGFEPSISPPIAITVATPRRDLRGLTRLVLRTVAEISRLSLRTCYSGVFDG